MQIDKSQIIEFLRQRGYTELVDAAEQRLPDRVDSDEHGGLLAQHGISVNELKEQFGDRP